MWWPLHVARRLLSSLTIGHAGWTPLCQPLLVPFLSGLDGEADYWPWSIHPDGKRAKRESSGKRRIVFLLHYCQHTEHLSLTTTTARSLDTEPTPHKFPSSKCFFLSAHLMLTTPPYMYANFLLLFGKRGKAWTDSNFALQASHFAEWSCTC